MNCQTEMEKASCDAAEDIPPIAPESDLLKMKELADSVRSRLGVKQLPTDPEALDIFSQESLLRFARARRSIAASTDMILKSLKWRREYDFFGTMDSWVEDKSEEAEYLRNNWPCGCHGVDRRGVPVYYARYGQCDMALAAKTAGVDRFIQYNLWLSYQGWKGIRQVAIAQGKHPVTMICVADMKGLDWKTGLRAVPYFKRLSAALDNNFPEKLEIAFVVNAPRIFSSLYKLASHFLAEDTKHKVRIFGHNEDHLHAKSGMLEVLDWEQIPSWLGGGPSPCSFPETQDIPRQ